MISFYFKIFVPDHIFVVKSMKFGMEVLLGELLDISSVFDETKKFDNFLCISVMVDFGINDVKWCTVLNELFWNLEHTMTFVVIVPRVD